MTHHYHNADLSYTGSASGRLSDQHVRFSKAGRGFASRHGHTKDHHKMVQTASLRVFDSAP